MDSADVENVISELNRRLDPVARTTAEALAWAKRWGSSVHLSHVPRVKCADGFEMSVQASGTHYCSPRDSDGPWSAVEIGFPTARVEGFMPYIDGDETTEPTDTVYDYVPIEIVAQAIIDHGGFATPVEAA